MSVLLFRGIHDDILDGKMQYKFLFTVRTTDGYGLFSYFPVHIVLTISNFGSTVHVI